MAHAMASVLGPGPLSVAELHAARLDGELYALDERFSPVDEVDTSWQRATALRSVAGSRMVAELRSALWIHGLRAFPPSVHTMCVGRSERVKFRPSPRFAVREMGHVPGDTVEIAGLLVTVPARILYDLAFLDGEREAADAGRILDRWPQLARSCIGRIRDARNLPGKGAALRRLAGWRRDSGIDEQVQTVATASAGVRKVAVQPALTRYTS